MAVLNAHAYRVPWWLTNGHLQTVWAPFFRPRIQVQRTAERLDTPDGDFVMIHTAEGKRDMPAVIMLHGLEGSANSKYILGMTEKLAALGWTSITLEYRGCSDEMNLAPRMYHSGETTDLAMLATRIAPRYERVYLAGFSLGGNVITKWLGESPDEVPENVIAAAAVCAPFDLTVAGPHIDRLLGGLYARHFLRTLQRKAIAKERQFPGCIDVERVRAARTLRDFDNDATAVMHGFDGVDHYYGTQRCGRYLDGIRVPILLLSSADDPFNPSITLPREEADASDYLHPQFTDRGGHVGFVYGSPFAQRYWAEEQIVRFFACYNEMAGKSQ
ncbi:MAG TPA: alpha/beta fold hydrolase [Candidatus Hydrogenedentes bacterium]|nr:alpha/beta fold hydrolase [Candidatus Hydrogenedentota bacterium]